MEYKQKSWFQKSKLKEAAKQENAKHPQISSFFKKKDRKAVSMNCEQEPEGTLAASTSPPSTAVVKDEDVPPELADSESLQKIATPAITPLHGYSMDRGHFPEKTDANVKRHNVSKGPCKSFGPFPRDPTQGNRCFSTAYYTSKTKFGLQIPLTWLKLLAQVRCSLL